MVKRQIRVTDQTKIEIKIDAAKTSQTANAVIIGILKDIKNWQIRYKHERINIPLSKSLVIEYSDSLRITMLRRAEKINANSQKGKKISQEMIIHQIIESYYNGQKLN